MPHAVGPAAHEVRDVRQEQRIAKNIEILCHITGSRLYININLKQHQSAKNESSSGSGNFCPERGGLSRNTEDDAGGGGKN